MSAASLRILSLVSGLPGAKRRLRVLVMLQAYMDESGEGDPDIFVLAGFVSTVERWTAFSDEWQHHLDHHSAHYRKLEYFKMAEMFSERDRERCRWFFNVIEDHALAAISCTIPVRELRRQVSRIFDDPRERAELGNPWHFAMTELTGVFVNHKEKLPNLPNEPVDFVFDETANKKVLIEGFEAATLMHGGADKLPLTSTPSFRNDKEYLPLQAADMLAWWIHHWQEDGIKQNITKCQFPWPRKRKFTWMDIPVSTQEMRRRLKRMRDLKYGGYRSTSSWPPLPGQSS